MKNTLKNLQAANELMKIYWSDEISQSYKNQPSKVAKRLYSLIKKKRNNHLLTLKLSEIEEIVKESFDLSIF